MLNDRYLVCLLLLGTIVIRAQEIADYGADVSFPIHHAALKDGPLGNRNPIYKEYMDGCRKFYGKKAHSCDVSEEGRLAMSIRQPQSMVVSSNIHASPLPKTSRSHRPVPNYVIL